MPTMATTQVAFDVCPHRSRAFFAIHNLMYSIMAKAITSQDASSIIIMSIVGFLVFKVRYKIKIVAYLYHFGQGLELEALQQMRR